MSATPLPSRSPVAGSIGKLHRLAAMEGGEFGKHGALGPGLHPMFLEGVGDARDFAHAQDALVLHRDVGGVGIREFSLHVRRGSAFGVGINFPVAHEPRFHLLRDVPQLRVPVFGDDLAGKQVGVQPRVVVFLVAPPHDHAQPRVGEPSQPEVGDKELFGDGVVDRVAGLLEETQIGALGGFLVELAVGVVELFVVRPGDPAQTARGATGNEDQRQRRQNQLSKYVFHARLSRLKVIPYY